MQVQGIIKYIGYLQKVSDKFQKQEVVITIDATTPYPQHVQFQLTQDKCSLLASLEIGDSVTAEFNLRGRKWNGAKGIQYFNTLEIWKIKKEGQSNASQTTQAPTTSNNDMLDTLHF